MVQSFEGRDFKFWHYNISHGELLIRSIKSSERTKNVDIMFFDVIYVDLPRNLPNLIIEEPTDNDIIHVKKKISKPVNSENIIILSSNDKRYLVVASIMKIAENELDMFELPFSNF